MDARGLLELANDNAVAHWLGMALAEGWEVRVGPGYTAVRCDRDAADSHRVVLTRRPDEAVGGVAGLTGELLGVFRDWDTRQLCLEDPYRLLDFSGYGCEPALPMPVMVRPAGPVPDSFGTGAAPGRAGGAELVVSEALAEDELADVERVVVEGFPMPGRLPWSRGQMFPAAWADIPGRRNWLVRRQGMAAGACVSVDDGASVGLYWVSVLPEQRSRGVARALLDAVLREHPDRSATLTATLLGEPLYLKAGFVEQGTALWWRYPGAARPVSAQPTSSAPR
ncbi:GNAT family N-acetyltransferase [Streptacidiphilus sp. EB129]|uniref:GNAT family N-acetyltransferase n=1 Tax=Streptacidiphilus sp. EB129 TaxID=3156262 RepID=UPI003518CB71